MKSKTSLVPLFLFCTIATQTQTKEIIEDVKPKVFVVLDNTVNDSAMYEQYRKGVEFIIKKYGGKYLVRSGGMTFDQNPEVSVIPIEGGWNPNRFIIVEWNSIEALQKITNSEEYKQIAVLREKPAKTKSIVVKEYLKN
ncbi:DUF1330 domain-containing protein [Flavobacterium sp. J49]|nr:DUF1330 domain-containing protein [Flavobacterium sp. J49]MBF6640149.1 DUF1330 domain-containing protein [Flavobacterium sp. J49]